MDRRPVIAVAAFLLAGTLCGTIAPGAAGIPWALAALALVLFLPARGAVRVAAALALLAGGANGALRGDSGAYAGPPRMRTFEATVLDVDGSARFGSRFTARIAGGKTLDVTARTAPAATCERILLHGRLEAFDGPRNPGEPDGRVLAAERGRFARLTHASFVRIARCDQLDPVAWLPRARGWASGRVRERIAEPYATILAGALWGERGSLPRDLRAEFQETGTMHVLVTAGLHVGVIAALSALLLESLGAGRVRAALFTIAVVWGYAALSGGHLPSLRAATMATFGLAAHACGRRAVSWNALACAAIVIAWAWPAATASVSFALSFSCVAAILMFARPIATWLEARRVPAVIAEAVALTLATQAGTWPLTAQTFFVVAPYSPLANAAVVPLTAAALLGGVALLAASPLNAAAAAVAEPETLLLQGIAWVVHEVSALPGAALVIGSPPAWSIAAYDAAALAAAMLRCRAPRSACALFASACLLVANAPRGTPGTLRVTVLDVGQGDAIVIQTPSRHAIEIDAGGALERGVAGGDTSPAERVGERVVVPFLLRSGITHLDALILTHPHGDHVGGCAPILRTIAVDRVITNGQSYSGFAFNDCLHEAAARNVPVVTAHAGQGLATEDGVRLDVLAPFDSLLSGTEDDYNENSVVVMLSYNRTRMLFMGDAGAFTERRLLESGIDLHAAVLKVGHHGSASASTPAFIARVAPEYAIISDGRDNAFGHPAPQTLATLREANIEILRTDLAGAAILQWGDTGGAEVRQMPSPLSSETIAAICAHMNEDHADAVASYARAYAGIPEPQAARLSGMDATGMDLEVETASGARSARVAFDHVLLDADDARETLIRLAREARAGS